MSHAADAAVGMMDSAYFVGRKELLDFFNELLDLNLSKIEETASGAIACQLTDLIFPGSIQMSRINWGARADFEFVANYKLLQNAFTQHRIQRHVDVDKLIRAKYQDNLEFCQWMKAFYEQSGSPWRDDYNATAVRERGKDGKQYNAKMGRGSSAAVIKRGSSARTTAPSRPAAAPRTTNPRPTTTASTTTTSRPTSARPTAATSTARSTAAPRGAATVTTAPTQPLKERTANPPVAPPKDDGKDKAAIAELEAFNTELVEKTEELTVQNEDLIKRSEFLEEAVLETEGERDFYFEKLRNIEIFLQIRGEHCEKQALIDDVFKILYATKEADVLVNDDGEVVPVNGNDAAVAAAQTSALAEDEDADAISLGDVIDG